MNRSQITKAAPVALTLLIIAVIIAAIVTIVRMTMFSGGSVSPTTTVDAGRQALLSSAADHSVRMTVRGPLVSDENFRTYSIEVTPNGRTLSSTKGYMGSLTAVASQSNNIPAYEQFVYALDKANFAKGIELTGAKNDLRGICATGNIYKFEIISSGTIVKQLWTSDCDGSQGSFVADLGQITNLFQIQIPKAESLISKIWQ